MENEPKITDANQVYVEVDTNSALRVKGVADLVATLTHMGAVGEVGLRMKDVDTGEVFVISYQGKE